LGNCQRPEKVEHRKLIKIMKTLNEVSLTELSQEELNDVQGGISIIRIEGWFDGEPGSRGYLFGKKIWDTY